MIVKIDYSVEVSYRRSFYRINLLHEAKFSFVFLKG